MRQRKKNFYLPVLALSLLPLFLNGCDSNNFPVYNLIDSLRVLGLQADQPEVYPGTTVTITPFISDVDGGGRTLTYSAQACVDPGTSYGATPTCDGSSTQTILIASATAAAPVSSASTGTTTTISVPVPSDILDGQSAQNQYNGVTYLFIYQLSAPGASTVTAFKRIIVVENTKTGLNTNPGTSSNDILFNGAASASLAALPSGSTNLQLQYNSADLQSYQLETSSGSFQQYQEQLITTWFISDGTVNTYRTINGNTTAWSPPSAEPTGRTAVVVAVTRDGRGGISFLKKEF